MPDGITISFVVIAYNEAGNIARTLSAITQLAGLDRYEVIVVNDGSRDRTTEVVADFERRDQYVRLIDLHRNHGRGYARSIGIAATRGDLIATVDADIILPADWLVRARAALRDHGAVGGTAVPDGDAAYLYKRFGLVPRLVGHTTTVTGSNALYHRRVFDLVGFDPMLREGEDVALNHAIERQGLSAATVPGLLVRHEESKTWAASLRWMFVSGKGATRQLFMYRQLRTPDIATGAFAGAVTLGLSTAVRGGRLGGVAIPSGFLLAASIQHVRSRFETPWSQRGRVVPAIGADSTLLAAYFAGRLAGVAGLLRHLPAPAQAGQASALVRRLRAASLVGRYRRHRHPGIACSCHGIVEKYEPVAAANDPVMDGYCSTQGSR